MRSSLTSRAKLSSRRFRVTLATKGARRAHNHHLARQQLGCGRGGQAMRLGRLRQVSARSSAILVPGMATRRAWRTR